MFTSDNAKMLLALAASTVVFAAVIALCIACPLAMGAMIWTMRGGKRRRSRNDEM